MKKLFILLTTGVVMTGCVSLVENNIDNASTIRILSRQIDCELKAAFPPVDLKAKVLPPHWTVTYTISQKVTDTQSASLDPLTWITPTRFKKLNLGFDASVSNEQERNAKAEFNRDLYETAQIACDAGEIKKSRFRFKAWTDQALEVSHEVISSFGYTITTTTSGSAGLGPDFANERIEATGVVGAGREAQQTIDFGFSKYSPPQRLKVEVTNFPTGWQLPPEQRSTRPRENRRSSSGPQTPLYNIPFENLLQNRSTIQQLQLDRLDRKF